MMDLGNEDRERYFLAEETFAEQQGLLFEHQPLRQKEQEYQEQLQEVVNDVYSEHLNDVPMSGEKEIERQQETITETSAEGENMIEEGTTNLQYQDLDEVLRGEIKHLSMVLQNQCGKLLILEQTYKDIVEENTQSREYICELKAMRKQLDETIKKSDTEIENICQVVDHHEKIIQQLKEYVKIIKNGKERIQSRTNEFYESAKTLVDRVMDRKRANSTEISCLLEKIEAKKQSIAVIKKNMNDKKIADIRAMRAGLDIRYEEALRKLKQAKEKIEESQERITVIVDKTERQIAEIGNLEDPSAHLLEAKERKNATEKNKQELLDKLESMRREYDAKMDEKYSLLTKKYELNKCQLERESKLACIRVVDESIEVQKGKIDELDQKIADLKQDDKLEKLLKENAYLEASRNFIEQKYKKTETKSDDLSIKVENLRKENTDTKEKVTRKQMELSKIKNSVEMRKTDVQQTVRTNTGILKPIQRPKSPVSPKKVTFTNVPSSESSGDVNVSQTTQRTTFDEMLAEFKF